ncbi:MAG: Kazal-type serine protease inhibitor family protein [Thermoanaerobaculia bacterium]
MMKNAIVTTAALLVVLAAWPAAAGITPPEPAVPETAAVAAEAPEAPAPEVCEPRAAETPSVEVQVEPIEVAAGGDCNCPDVYDPVCGSNGVTYSNACYARCDGITEYTEGACGSTS